VVTLANDVPKLLPMTVEFEAHNILADGEMSGIGSKIFPGRQFHSLSDPEVEILTALGETLELGNKDKKLIETLHVELNRLAERGAPQKAVIFTASSGTREYLECILQEAGFGESLTLLNGDTDLDGVSRSERKILLATDETVGAVNLDFCPLVINYDQASDLETAANRIGRVHRISQKHDVVVDFQRTTTLN
jgi:superfamily II DNA/RNA helicase